MGGGNGLMPVASPCFTVPPVQLYLQGDRVSLGIQTGGKVIFEITLSLYLFRVSFFFGCTPVRYLALLLSLVLPRSPAELRED